MKYLVYGHSQSGGMGLDFVKQLKKAGHTVTRVTKVGWSDLQLKGGIPELTGDPSQYDGIFYFAGANPKGRTREQISETILENVATLGGKSKVVVILAPYNAAKEPANILEDPNTRGYLYEKKLKEAGVRVYRPLFPSTAFWPDKIHVKPYCKESSQFAADVISGKEITKNTYLIKITVASAIALISLATAIWYFKFRK